MKRFLLLLILFAFITGFAFSYDYGLLTDQRFEFDNEAFVYYPIFIPWFSWDGGEGLSVYLSGILSLKYRSSKSGENDGWGSPALVPEISRFSARYRLQDNFFIEAGRITYSDCLGMTAYGLFDGVKIETGLPVGYLNAGLFFTGLLYKETAQIMMTETDAFNFVDKDNYFASSRFFANARYDLPIQEEYLLSLETLFQFDINGASDFLHSQYAQAMVEFFPQNKAGVAVGALFELMERKNEVNAAFGALARFRMDMPTEFDSGVRVTCKFTSGPFNDTSYAFAPVSSPAMGLIFSETISGLALISADYTARLRGDLLADAALSYFFRTYKDPLVDGSIYGCELQASVAWQPYDDLRASLGCGLFFPGLGNIYADTKTLWKIKASIMMSF
ncbi:MAG: hypothetical protein FWD22_01735 [Treponema sp.]|nr:hypothetical protein [Treponema sp.]